MKILKAITRYLAFAGLILIFIIHQAMATIILRNEIKRLRYFMKSIRLASLAGLWILNIDHKVEGAISSQEGRLVISNHLSYVDILILSAYYPALFVTSVEMKEVPVLGHITRLAGCFFVERRKSLRDSDTLAREINSMNEKLKAGFDVCLFPEGTSSDGSGVLPFKSTFFQTAIDCQSSILPLCIKYERGADFIPWYGKMTFSGHLFQICLADGAKARVSQLDIVKPELSRAELKQLCYERILCAYTAN